MNECTEVEDAARGIRDDIEFGQAHGDDAFLSTVADWLEYTADTWTMVSRGDRQRALATSRAYLAASA